MRINSRLTRRKGGAPLNLPRQASLDFSAKPQKTERKLLCSRGRWPASKGPWQLPREGALCQEHPPQLMG
ncbi:hypothetical protein QQF64_020246 [Cirrhinus molitorella]|uniref:Uncharacterized protein n=1 Tax=Cirrhinus molitorella TaxID=172907 RepID=A0ABR3LAY1_9TELE